MVNKMFDFRDYYGVSSDFDTSVNSTVYLEEVIKSFDPLSFDPAVSYCNSMPHSFSSNSVVDDDAGVSYSTMSGVAKYIDNLAEFNTGMEIRSEYIDVSSEVEFECNKEVEVICMTIGVHTNMYMGKDVFINSLKSIAVLSDLSLLVGGGCYWLLIKFV